MPGNYDGPTDINNNYHNNNNGSYARANNAQPSQRGHMDNRQEEYMNQQQVNNVCKKCFKALS